jgi:hypothetical protein
MAGFAATKTTADIAAETVAETTSGSV